MKPSYMSALDFVSLLSPIPESPWRSRHHVPLPSITFHDAPEEGIDDDIAAPFLRGDKQRNNSRTPLFRRNTSQQKRRWRFSSICASFAVSTSILGVSLFVSLLLNLYFLLPTSLHVLSTKPTTATTMTTTDNSFAHASLITTSSLHSADPYTGRTNMSQANALWDGLDTSPRVVALANDYATAHDLPTTIPWPLAPQTHGLYHIKVYEQLHCLKLIRSTLMTLSPHDPSDEVHDCLASLKSDIECNADDTPLSLSFSPSSGTSSAPKRTIVAERPHQRTCHRLEDVADWAKRPEHVSCYSSILEDHTDEAFTHSLDGLVGCDATTTAELRSALGRDSTLRPLDVSEALASPAMPRHTRQKRSTTPFPSSNLNPNPDADGEDTSTSESEKEAVIARWLQAGRGSWRCDPFIEDCVVMTDEVDDGAQGEYFLTIPEGEGSWLGGP